MSKTDTRECFAASEHQAEIASGNQTKAATTFASEARQRDAKGETPCRRYMPIQADDVQRRHIDADSTINPDHLGTLDELKRLWASKAGKDYVFCNSLDEQSQQILDELLEVAIGEIEQEHGTVVGVVNVLILKMLDISCELRSNGTIQSRGNFSCCDDGDHDDVTKEELLEIERRKRESGTTPTAD